MADPIRKYVRYPIEAGLAWLSFGFFRLMPATMASALGGWLGRTIGPRVGVSRRAMRNIDLAMPGTPEDEKARIISGCGTIWAAFSPSIRISNG